jgi:SAM-dependent methyltransferase
MAKLYIYRSKSRNFQMLNYKILVQTCCTKTSQKAEINSKNIGTHVKIIITSNNRIMEYEYKFYIHLRILQSLNKIGVYLNLKTKITLLICHPSIIKDILQGKILEEICIKLKLHERRSDKQAKNEVSNFIRYLKQTSPFHRNPHNEPKLNKLCCIEDWQNDEINEIISELQKVNSFDYIYRKNWEMKSNVVNNRKTGFIHRKDWEWALGIIAMHRFGKLNKNMIAIGVGVGREEVLFYLANYLCHVHATDLYDGRDWKNFAPSDFPGNPKKYAPFSYREDALTVLRMDGTKLEFPSDIFDIAFSFSSIEHFGGVNHSGSLKSLREMERVLKPGGIAVITTEYIINDKEHPEFFNRRTIYSDLVDRLEKLRLVEPLDLRITINTLDTVLDYPSAVYWDTSNDDEFKKKHPLILIRVKDTLVTSIMLVFQKKE